MATRNCVQIYNFFFLNHAKHNTEKCDLKIIYTINQNTILENNLQNESH